MPTKSADVSSEKSIPHFSLEVHHNELQCHGITDSMFRPWNQHLSLTTKIVPNEVNEHGIADVSSTPTGLHFPVRLFQKSYPFHMYLKLGLATERPIVWVKRVV